MAKDVDRTLGAIIGSERGMQGEAVLEYTDQFKTDRRYQRDIY